MGSLEQKIKDFVKEQGIAIVGIAGPDRLDGPPSLDPTYTLPGAKSVVSLVMPMDVKAINQFLSKEAYQPHWSDQIRGALNLNRVSAHIAGYIKSLGYRAQEVVNNTNYRRHPDAFKLLPTFSHRCATLASGIAARGWSGNVMTEEFGGAMYLGSVVTEAVLESDKPRYEPRHFIDKFCHQCRMCEKTCVAGMFDAKEEEYMLVNGELHPRGKIRDIDLCNASCFGLHCLSRDKKWTTWGTRWIDDWVDAPPDPNKPWNLRFTLFKEGVSAGDSTPRYSTIKQLISQLHPKDVLEEHLQKLDNAKSETERFKLWGPIMEAIGVTGKNLFKNEQIITCGNCCTICGPTVDECANRYHTLIESGFVVPGPDGEVVNVDSYEEAVKMRKKYQPQIPATDMVKDFFISAVLYHKHFFGVEPKTMMQGAIYNRKLNKAVAQKITGHLATAQSVN